MTYKTYDILRSPFFYVGDKYKLVPQLKRLSPCNIKTYIEPFLGGGSSFLNTQAQKYIANDIDKAVILLHKMLLEFSGKKNDLFECLYSKIKEYNLSCSKKGITPPKQLKQQYKKTYYSHYNKTSYLKMREDYNKTGDIVLLYLLLIYGFNHMIRFNASGAFNLPCGNVDFNSNVYSALSSYLDFVQDKDISFCNMDYKEFLKITPFDASSYIYFDPPYLISNSEYNKLWTQKDEAELIAVLDDLNDNGIHFGITNLIRHKGKTNDIFLTWAKKHYAYEIKSNYISFNDNTIKKDSFEVFVTNRKVASPFVHCLNLEKLCYSTQNTQQLELKSL